MIDPTNLPLLVTLALGVFAGALDLGVLSPALPALAHTPCARASRVMSAATAQLSGASDRHRATPIAATTIC
jgi:hypothetical protein